jgi:DNA-binding response OmpR family regulator
MKANPATETDPGVIPAPGVDVLHVEDDDAYAEFVRKWVAPSGLTTHRVRSRAELLDYLSSCSRPPRCLLLDLGLNDSHGLSLCDAIKQAPSLQQLPIVLYSGANLTSCECMKHGVLHFVRKGADGGPELLAALTAVISQHSRSQGVVDLGDLRLNPPDLEVSLAGRPVAKLTPGRFAALLLLVKSAPKVVTDEELYSAFLQRHPYHRKDDLQLAILAIVKNYVSHLRSDLGPVGARIERVRGEGYAYRP